MLRREIEWSLRSMTIAVASTSLDAVDGVVCPSTASLIRVVTRFHTS